VTGHTKTPKMLIGLEGARAFCVSIFGAVEQSVQLSIFGTVSFALPLCAKARPKSDAASQTPVAEKIREEANTVTPKKWRPLNLGLIGRQKRFSRACREGKPARKRPHLRLDGGHYRHAM
jgi:hypothetical protein